LAQALGSEDAINVAHSHTVTDPGHNHSVITNESNAAGGTPNWWAGDGFLGAASVTSQNNTTGLTVNGAGASGTGANMPPTIFFYVHVKL
jgi:hypothetical protein